MTRQSKRKQPRIPYQGKVDLYFPAHRLLGCTVQNLSLIGMRVQGCQEAQEGERCDIEFHDAAPMAGRSIRMLGELIRKEETGAAILFLNLNVRTYTDLQALIADQGGLALMEEDEFLAGVSA